MQKEIESKLIQYRDPYLGTDLLSAKAVKQITVEKNRLTLEITLGYPFKGAKAGMEAGLKKALLPVAGGREIEILFSTKIERHNSNQTVQGLSRIKNIIAVASGKGGVGKSTVSVNLALALAKEGAKVGILDADIYGPSQPMMLNAQGVKPALNDEGLQPIERHGIQSMSIGYLVEQTAAMVWRGPMLGKAMQQMLNDTVWQDLDYLIVDLPPGTGDVQLTLCQKMPVSGAVIVTTPQDLALLDVRRACEMFQKLNVPILGVVENMSVYHCPKCGHEEAIFGTGGAEKLAAEYGVTRLASVPLDIRIRELTDSGQPPVASEPEGAHAEVFGEMARQVAAKLSLQPKDYSLKFPKVVVDHASAEQKKE